MNGQFLCERYFFLQSCYSTKMTSSKYHKFNSKALVNSVHEDFSLQGFKAIFPGACFDVFTKATTYNFYYFCFMFGKVIFDVMLPQKLKSSENEVSDKLQPHNLRQSRFTIF